jgi:putative two-component system response regulator
MGLALGAADFLAKPISPPILFARVATHLALDSARQQLRERNRQLEKIVGARSAQLAMMQGALAAARASHADPALQDVFIEIERQFARIAAEFA